MNIPRGYKQTELGIIPEEWEVIAFKDLGSFSKGSGISRAEANTGKIPCVRYGELYTHHSDYVKSFNSFISEEVASRSKLIKYGDILFAASGETKEDIGKSVAYTNLYEAYAGGDIIIISTNPIICDAKYIGYASNAPIVAKQKATRGQGDAIVHITSESIKNIAIPLPPLSEQKAIAKALSDVDDLIAALDKKIAKKRLVKQGAMQQLLTGKKRLPGFTEEWVDRKLCNFGFMVRGVSYKPEQSSLSPKEGYSSLLRSNNVQGDSIVYSDYVYVDNNYVSEKQKIVKNDILICIANGSKQLVGKSALIEKEGDFTFGAFMGVFRCEDQNIAPFVVSLMHSECYKKQIEDILTGSAINNLNASTIESMLFFVPASTEEQLAIASILSDMDKEIVELETRRDKYRLLKSGMMQKLLTGQVRLNK